MAGASTSSMRTYLETLSQMVKETREHNVKNRSLPALDLRFSTIEEFVLAEGCTFKPSPLPKGVRKGRFKECFSNAHKLAMRSPERYVYCEGFAHSGVIPVLHAWVFDTKTNALIDNTWSDDRGKEYIGVPMRLDYVNRVLVKTGYYGVLGNLWLVPAEMNPLLTASEYNYLHPRRDEWR